jgi:hypothetical protein
LSDVSRPGIVDHDWLELGSPVRAGIQTLAVRPVDSVQHVVAVEFIVGERLILSTGERRATEE